MAFPTTEEGIRDILATWAVKLPLYKTMFGLTQEQIDQVITDSMMTSHIIPTVNSFQDDVDEVYTYKTNLMKGDPKGTLGEYPIVSLEKPPTTPADILPGIYKRNSELYNYFKKHPNRTAEALADLGISTAPKPKPSPDALAPNIGGKPQADDTVVLSFNKQGQPAIRFRGRLAGEDWSWTIDAIESPVTDMRPSANGKPEKREYQGIYLKKNKPYGQYSQIITVVTTP